jgi:hypothetical protein
MPDQLRRYLGLQKIPLVEYLRLYYQQSGWTGSWDGTLIEQVETLNPEYYRLHLADGRKRTVSYRAKVTVTGLEQNPVIEQ